MNERQENLNADNSPKKNKFLFDINNFDLPPEDENVIEEEIPYVPPPPVFSEDEMEAAKAIAHSQGVNEGRFEEKQRREEEVANTLNNIALNFSSLFAAEIYREKQYEEESLRLALELIDTLAPSLQNRLGKESLKIALKDVLKRQSEQSEIRVEVDPESAADIDKYIDTIWTDKSTAPRYRVVANSDLEKGACEIYWEDGGMIRSPKKTAQDIKTAIEALLVEQVMAKDKSILTNGENNVINEEDNSDSLAFHTSEDSNGENEND